MQIKEALQWYNTELSSVYDENERNAISQLVLMHILNFSKAKLLASFDLIIDDEKLDQLKNYLPGLLKSEPVQYVLGETEFYGLKFFVNNNVLIPRPETEELVQLILNDISKETKLSILDIGTGSGCIPIAIKKSNAQLNVFALDISTNAITVAKQNALQNNVEVTFFEADILNFDEAVFPNKMDIIVSNPPYVCKSEMGFMQANVLNYEPHLALFVADDDALLFYKAIADFALRRLSPNGKLYFEINEAKGLQVADMLLKKGFQNIVLKKDMFGKDRMIKCEMNA